jgi:cell wall-associated NlpC family hydrolase
MSEQQPCQTAERASHTGRRRPQQHVPSWVRRAGLAGGVIGTFALTAVSGPASAAPTHEGAGSPNETTASIPVIPAFDTTAGETAATEGIEENAADLTLAANRADAQAAALKQAHAKRHADARRAAAARAAHRAAEARTRAARTAAPVTGVPLSASTASSGASAGSSAASTGSSAAAPASGRVTSVLSFLRAQLGKPYVYGATGPGSYDCSGLTQAAFRTIGVDLPRTAAAQSTTGSAVSLGALRPGDLLFWGGVGSAYHVAVYIGGGEYLNAANPSEGVLIERMSDWPPTSARRVA